ncbi:MAG: type II asparaginase [Azoarcus sp.]|jgi:L-asparaginase|nr:type II asparaginase [Azoarcus sp.]
MGYFGRLKQAVSGFFPAHTREDKNTKTAENTASPRGLPNIHILATGGTIAGRQTGAGPHYQAGEQGIEALIGAVPTMRGLANISSEQVTNIGSQDMDEKTWLKLVHRVNELLTRADVDGIIITHGTDTLEETAYFLDLTVPSGKPVVLVGAMRPANAVGADGPANLFDAVVVASSPDSAARGVLVAMNGNVFEARDVTKVSTTAVQAFAAPNFGPLGQVHDGRVFYWRSSDHRADHTSARQHPEFDVSGLDMLPAVGIVYGHANAPALPVTALVEAQYRGIVSAGVGNGNLYHEVLAALADAASRGIAVVRSSRVAAGPTMRGIELDDARYGFVAAGTLNPQKARVLLQLALTRTQEPGEIQKMFDYC